MTSWMWAWLLVGASAGAGLRAGTEASPPGVLFLNPKDLIISGQEWRVIVEVNATDLVGEVERLEEASVRLEEDLRMLQEVDPRFHQPHQEVLRILEIVRQALTEAEEIEAYLPPPAPRRRRGFVNVGGTVIKFLFGNPDADDFDTLQSGLAQAKSDAAKCNDFGRCGMDECETQNNENTENIRRFDFAEMVALSLIKPHLRERLTGPNLSNELRSLILEVLGGEPPMTSTPDKEEGSLLPVEPSHRAPGKGKENWGKNFTMQRPEEVPYVKKYSTLVHWPYNQPAGYKERPTFGDPLVLLEDWSWFDHPKGMETRSRTKPRLEKTVRWEPADLACLEKQSGVDLTVEDYATNSVVLLVFKKRKGRVMATLNGQQASINPSLIDEHNPIIDLLEEYKDVFLEELFCEVDVRRRFWKKRLRS
ncbi:hypothetical protein GE061_001358 [Apolygus lucorum]|uniref:Uncharacterized protein n=1 Tax=Apolygus lucorum TaxID=248454 RepID=A0A8S9YAP2_APOLU|nr:hypothetical protein GE061_001358 [Apolygus lucorum]